MRFQSLCSLIAAGTVAGALACGEDISFPVLPTEEFQATLSGANEVPPVATTATGTVTFAVQHDTVLGFRVDVAGIDSTTVARIYAAGAGVAGGDTIAKLFTGPTTCSAGTINSPRCRRSFTGQLAQGQFRPGQLVVGPDSIGLDSTWGATPRERFDSLLILMRTGNVYVNVHTRANAGGEIRGQVQVP